MSGYMASNQRINE